MTDSRKENSMIEFKKSDDVITKRIKATINFRGYENQKKFCESFDPNLNESLLSDIFNGKRRTIENLLLIADKLDCSLDYLVGKSEILSINPVYKMIEEELHLSQRSIEFAKQIHLISAHENTENPLDYLLSFPDPSKVLALFHDIVRYFEEDGVLGTDGFPLHDFNGQVSLWAINHLLQNMKENSDKYISALEEAISKIENNPSKTDYQDSLMKLYKYKLSSITEERNAQALLRKEKKENNG